MPVINKPTYRPPASLAAKDAPQPISPLGGGRGGALMAFKEGQIK